MRPTRAFGRLVSFPKRVSRVSSTSTMTGEQLITLFLQRSLGLFQGRRKCVDAGRGSASREAEGLKSPPPPPPPFVPRGGPQHSATTRPSAACRRTLSARSVWETRSVARAGPAQTFCKCNLDIPGEAGMRGSGGGGGRQAKAKAAASSGADSRWAKGLKGSQSGSRNCCQSRGSRQSHPCHFQNLGPTVPLKCGCALCQSLEDRVGNGHKQT